jgi:hypothetical protein
MRRAGARALWLVLLGASTSGAAGEYGVLTSQDVVDPSTGKPAEIVPDAPWVSRGPIGWSDATIDPSVVGDVDVVVRTGLAEASFLAIPPPTALSGALPQAVAEPLEQGVKIPFVVVGSSAFPLWPDGTPLLPWGARTYEELEGKHVAVAVFADLDADGYVGVTLLDGDAADVAIERAERVPVGSHIYLGWSGAARGQIASAVGGPAGARLRVAVAAGAYLGSFRADYFGGALPDGPAVFTHLPFHPETDPALILDGTVEPPNPYNPLELLGVDVRLGLDADPKDPRYGEAFTLRLDGSSDSVDVAEVHSGAHAAFALARPPDPHARYESESLELRPALDPSGRRTVYEVPRQVLLRPESDGSEKLRLVPIDRLGNVADLPAPVAVTLRASGWLRIAEPNADGDDKVERVVVGDSRGVTLRLRAQGAGSSQGRQFLVVENSAILSAIEVALPAAVDLAASP